MDEVVKVHLYPDFTTEDKGDGGVRRVVEAQRRHLSGTGIEFVGPDEADVIACHMTAPEPYFKKFPDKAWVSHCHGLYWSNYEWDNWALKANEDVMRLCRVADIVTSPSDWVSNALLRHTSRDVRTVYHGIDMAEWEHDLEYLPYVLWNKTRPDPVCDPTPVNLVASLLSDVEFVSTFGHETKNVRLTGRLPYSDAKKLVQRAGVYLCTTKETFGIGTLEAMAAGVPVVGFNWGGQREIIRDESDGGIMVRPNDTAALARAIDQVLNDRARFSTAAKARAAEFSWSKAAQQYADIYRSLVKKHSGPRTTIVITNYNLHDYLPACLDSVKAQTDQNWECIVVDDASPVADGREIVDRYAMADKRFKLIANSENVYLAEARNIAIRQAKGKYILPLDADDMLGRETVKVLADALDENKERHITYGNVLFVREDGQTRMVYEGNESNPGHSRWPVPFNFVYQMRQLNVLPYCSMLRKSVWQQTGGYSPRCRTAEDAAFWSRAVSYGFRPEMVTEADTLIYRVRQQSMSTEQGDYQWIKWFPWAKEPKLAPAGAASTKQMPIAPLDEITVAVVIPVGPGHVKYVKDAVDSVDAQFFRDWECIVVNDSGQPLPELPAWVRVIEARSPIAIGKPVGVAAARNIGIAAARAPLFLPLDADDYLQPSALEFMVDAYKKTRDIIFTDFWEDPKEPGKFSLYKLPDYDPVKISRGTLHCVTALTPVSVWRDVAGYDSELPAWEDWDFQIKCAEKGICSRRLAAPLFTYRKHTGFRREDNVQNFERSKAGILAKWASLWENGAQSLMACAACGQRASINPMTFQSRSASPDASKVMADEAYIVEYLGSVGGNQYLRNAAGGFYVFSQGVKPFMVVASDVHLFLNRRDFKVTPRSQMVEPVVEVKEPVLMAEGNPN